MENETEETVIPWLEKMKEKKDTQPDADYVTILKEMERGDEAMNQKEQSGLSESRVQRTIELHEKGYNCAQSVACAYCDLVGVDEKIMFQIAEGFGLGMGCMEGTCGALSGACILAGLLSSTANLEKPDSKANTYKLSKQILMDFKKQNGAVSCKELKGIETGKVLRSCPDAIRDAAGLVEKVLFQ